MPRRALTVIAVTAAMVLVVGWYARVAAQKPIVQGAEVTETAVIEAIDTAARLVTLKAADGTVDTVYCGPDVQRFDQLKVGDKVTFRYYESVVFAIQQPGATPPSPESVGITRSATKPGGTIAKQMTVTVTVLEIDAAIPSISIRTESGAKMSFKVEDKKNLEGVKVGDKIQITYTQALAISVGKAGT